MKRGFVAVIVFVAFLLPSVATAESSIKRMILEDCVEALKELPSLTPEERKDLVLYLSRVLSLDVRNPAAREDFAPIGLGKQPGDRPLIDVPVGELWRSFEPRREIEAKECALKFVEELAPQSIGVLPEMILFGEDAGIPDALRSKVDRVILKLSEAASTDPSFMLDEDLGKRIIGLLKDPKAQFNVENVFIQFGSNGIPSLIEGLRQPNNTIRVGATEILRKVDPDGDLSGSGIVGILESADDAVRKNAALLLGEFPKQASLASLPLIQRLADVSPEVQDSAIAALVRYVAERATFPELGEKSIEIIVDTFTRFDHSRQERLAPVVGRLLERSPGLEGRLLSFYEGVGEETKIEVLGALGRSPKLSDAAFGIAVKALSDPSDELVIAGIRAISSDRSRLDSVLLNLSKLLKSREARKGAEKAFGRFSVASAQAVVELDAGAKASRLTPYFVAVLDAEEETQAEMDSWIVRALIKNGKDASAPLIRALKSPNSLVRKRAVFILGSSGIGFTAQLAEALADPHPSVRLVAQDILIKRGVEAVPTVRKYFKSKAIEARLSSATVVLNLSPQDKEASGIVVKDYSSLGCSDKTDLVNKLHLDLLTPAIMQAIVACLADKQDIAPRALSALVTLSPLPEIVSRGVLEVVRGRSLDRQIELNVLKEASRLGLPSDEVRKHLLELLKNSEDSVKLQVIRTLGGVSEGSSQVVPELVSVAKSSRSEAALRCEAVVSLTKLDPSAFDYEEFFLDQLQGDDSEWAEKGLQRIGEKLSTPLLLKAIDRFKGAPKVKAVHAIGSVNSEDPNVVARLLTLLSPDNPSLRYAAFVSLIGLNPNNPEIIPIFRSVLVSREGRALGGEGIHDKMTPLLKEILKEPRSKVEEYRAQELLAVKSLD